ncbi:MAG: N-acetyltransferase [Prevotellaceae bacterium]|jgi:hypothetical protein|nr:N-acetyltransferase [Prevotellaceae bacterium]
MVIIKEVNSRKELRKFIKFPFTLYKGYKYWIPPLVFDDWNTFRHDKNPAFEYADVAFFLAYKSGKPAGRVAAIINKRANSKWNAKDIRFGWIEFIDDVNVSRALLDAVAAWGKKRGMTRIHGPMGFTDCDPEGMLVDGFEKKSTITSIHNYPYYPQHMEQLGFGKSVDWVQYKFNASQAVPEKVERMNQLIHKKYSLTTKLFTKRKELLKYTHGMFEAINASFQELYGFVPLTEKEIIRYTNTYIGMIDPALACMVLNENKQVVGFGLSAPSLSVAMQKARGRLFPFGFIHLLRALRKYDEVDLYFNGVLPEWQHKGLNSIYFTELNKVYIRKQVTIAYSTNQLEGNKKADNMWHNYEHELYQRRRCYEKNIVLL